jgi:hypothetical protein
VLSTNATEGYGDLRPRILNLRKALDELEKIHLGGIKAGEYPSIRDAARFQFARTLVDQFLIRDARSQLLNPEKDAKKIKSKMELLRHTFDLHIDSQPNEPASAIACKTIQALGASPVGRSVLEWWRNYKDCYACPDLIQFQNRDPALESTWLALRHRSFEAVYNLAEAVAEVLDLHAFKSALRQAANDERSIAEQIEARVKELTQWCLPRGYQLLLAGKNADPLELCSAMAIADRIGEPWSERLEQEAFEVVSSLQHSDGSFPAVAPLYQNRGFTFYLPSATTIALLARFAAGGTQAPRREELRRRLIRWAPVLERGASFLISSLVGGDGPPGRGVATGRVFAGWHSDRHPEAERIDCFATTEAITALCRLDDALKWLLNFSAAKELRLSWPNQLLKGAVPSDCERGKDQLLLRMVSLIQQLQQASELHRLDHKQDHEAVDSRTFLYYGPPGTGKTYCQNVVAGELGWPVVTLTIGDFLRDGDTMVARRADEIFKRLSFLSNVCIVFDECDEMITVRSRKGERGWSGVPLLTATMLPLLSALRDSARE